MTPVEELRKAARLMRERAEAARGSLSDIVPDWHSVRGLRDDGKTLGDAEHIASWTPAVALAVADWLTQVADMHDHDRPCADCTEALTVTRAYVGGEGR